MYDILIYLFFKDVVLLKPVTDVKQKYYFNWDLITEFSKLTSSLNAPKLELSVKYHN